MMIARSREQRQRVGTQRVAAESETPREVLRLPEASRVPRQDIPGPPSSRMLRGAESEVEQMHNYISRIRFDLHEAIRNREGISSEATAELCIRGSHVHKRQPTERQTPGDGTLLRSTACCKRWRSPQPRCCQQLSRGVAGAGGRCQGQLGRESSLPCQSGHQLGRRGIRDPE